MLNTNHSAFSKGHKVVVFGASGHTGRFVIAELAGRGMTAILAARFGKTPGGPEGASAI